MQTEGSKKQNRGFASMDRERQREIARKGGRAAHEKGTAHQFTSDEARAAGRKGGERVSANREHMSRIGRLGGKSSAGRRATPAEGGGNGSHPGTEGSSSNGDAGATTPQGGNDQGGGNSQPGQPAM
jgi:hypothetical protein